jgi:hypothetical protein
MCDCLKTPKDFQVEKVRAMMSGWLSKEGLSLKDCIQMKGSSDCYIRSHDWFPKKCNLCVTDKPDQASKVCQHRRMPKHWRNRLQE